MHRKPPSASLCLKRSLFKMLWSFCPQFKAFTPLFLQVISLVCWHGELCKGTAWIFNTVTWGGELTPQESCHSLCASIESSGGAKKKGGGVAAASYRLNSTPHVNNWSARSDTKVFVTHRHPPQKFSLPVATADHSEMFTVYICISAEMWKTMGSQMLR